MASAWRHVPGKREHEADYFFERADPIIGGCVAKVWHSPGTRRFGWPAHWIADCLDGEPSAHATADEAKRWADERLARKAAA
jgi:hypothetical protein